MSTLPISDAQACKLLEKYLQGEAITPKERRLLVVWSLRILARLYPGKSVEVRVPPDGAVQAIKGVTHRRGTPPAVIEMTPEIWINYVGGKVQWQEVLSSPQAVISGQRADLSTCQDFINYVNTCHKEEQTRKNKS